uniref:Uncharacterized protein n=1 Tax=Virus NIOZ-UU159 TaxID=2763270 RepID=A0A7S9SUC7_9VIRU|nr:MAG: hypothetical protein NIOZUU159_00185 [Virus NIOZ-UU159]
MLSSNINIDNTLLLKELCNNINSNYILDKKNLDKDNITQYDYIIKSVAELEENYKNNILEEYSNKCINKNILYKLNNKFDGDQVAIICYSVLKEY